MKKKESDTFDLKILSHKYKVYPDTKASRDFNTGGGCTNFNDCKIEMDPTMPRSRYNEILIHEIIEALNFHLELELEHHKITLLGENLALVLAENPVIAEKFYA